MRNPGQVPTQGNAVDPTTASRALVASPDAYLAIERQEIMMTARLKPAVVFLNLDHDLANIIRRQSANL
jgi:hypothetical protein